MTTINGLFRGARGSTQRALTTTRSFLLGILVATYENSPIDAQLRTSNPHANVGLLLENLIADGCLVKAPCGGEMARKSPVDHGKPGTNRSVLTDGQSGLREVRACP